MTDDSERNELLEIYKLHAELADRVSQRREAANQRYTSMLVGLGAFVAALLRFGHGDLLLIATCLVSVLGMLMARSWSVVIQSYRQLNSGKFAVLHKLEESLAFPFFTREWELLGDGNDPGRYQKLTDVEKFLPWMFFALSAILFVLSLVLLVWSCFQ